MKSKLIRYNMINKILSFAMLFCCCFGMDVLAAKNYDSGNMRYCEGYCKSDNKIWNGKLDPVDCICVDKLKDQKIGDYCQSYGQCKGGVLLGKGVDCCDKTCTVKLEDYTGLFYYCPKDCRGKLGGAKGTCQ
jgi:hypothetical protein